MIKEQEITFLRDEVKVAKRVRLSAKQQTIYKVIEAQITYAKKSDQYEKRQKKVSYLALNKNSKKMLVTGGFLDATINGSKNTLIFNQDIIGDFVCSVSGEKNTIVTNADCSSISASGENAKVTSSGLFSQLSSSGYSCDLITSADIASVAASGDKSFLNSNGKKSRLVASGDATWCSADGKDSIIAIVGRFGRVSGAFGTYVCIADYDNTGTCRGFVTGRIGEKGLKPDTIYTVKNGRFVEASVVEEAVK
ncbi:hypothetical protein RAM19_05725 [Bartonella apihabitans]|nr:hypothetical protein [Bartonella apihabitans]WLT09629.1 hypothetical protein RAM19_05725 [Bartonella apihabitans]